MKSNTAIVCLSPYAGGMEFDSIRLYKLLYSQTNARLVVRKGSFLEKLARKEIGKGNICAIKFTANLGPSLVVHFKRFLIKENIKNVIYFGASELVSLFLACLNRKVNFIVRHGTTKTHSKKDIARRSVITAAGDHQPPA